MKKFISLVALCSLGALVYVYAETEAVKIGYTIQKQQERKTLLLDHARTLQYNISQLKAPQNLERNLKSYRIELQAPATWETLVLQKREAPKRVPILQEALGQGPYYLGRLFFGTAQAEAGERKNN